MSISAVQPVNPHAIPEAKHLLNFLYAIQGRYTLAGQHNYAAVGSKYTDKVHAITGKHPLIWGSDFSFCYQGHEPEQFQHCGPLNMTDPSDPPALLDVSMPDIRQAMVAHAIQKYREGYIITLMWHAGPPDIGDCCDGRAIWTLERRPSQAY